MLSVEWHEPDGPVPFRGLLVLTVAKVTGQLAAGYAEYLEGKAQPAELGDYYLKDGERAEAPGRWVQGAARVAADPALPVSGDQLRALMAVRRPDTGEPLRRAGAGGGIVAALDATFSAPKSVSAIWAIADKRLRAQIEEAHEQAIDRALDYSLQRVAMIRQRVDKETVIRAKPKGLVATSWRHTTARAVEGQPPDPQLHSHVLLHGAVRTDAGVVAIDSRSWLTHRREVGAAYRTELARELNRLGFHVQRGTGRGQRYFEIKGVPQALIDRWSTRHQQVQAAIQQRLEDQRAALRAIVAEAGPDSSEAIERLALLEHNGQLAPGEERLMASATRAAKALVTNRDLDEHWQATARYHGIDRAAIGSLPHQRPAMPPAEPNEVLGGLTEFDATFPARDARAVALERSAGARIADALEPLRQLRQAGEILVLADRTGTTREHRGREQATLTVAQRYVDTTVAPLPAAIVAEETKRLNRELAKRGGKLSSEQRRAIEVACGPKPLVVIEGQAGTGKSTTLIGIARAHQAANRQIVVTSTAGLAAERLARELADAGVQAGAYSIAALQSGIASGHIQLTAEMTIIHDEAALASTREQQQLLAAAELAGARLIEVGDPQQSQPVGAGGLWPHLEHTARAADAHVELTRNQRALDPDDQRDQALFRAGRHEQAIRGYAARDRIHITSEQAHAEDLALDAAHRDRQTGKTTIVIAQASNEHLDELNARAQAIRRQHRQLGRESVPVQGRPYDLQPADEIQIRRTLPRADHGPLRNGTSATIIDVDPDSGAVRLRLADGRIVELDGQETVRADLRLAYVQHPFPAQGQTTDTAHLIVGEHTAQEGSYVAITRAREQTHIHAAVHPSESNGADRLAVLAERMSRSEPDLPSISTPLAHENAVANEMADSPARVLGIRVAAAENTRPPEDPRAVAEREPALDSERPEATPQPELRPERAEPRVAQRGEGWASTREQHIAPPELADDSADLSHHPGWEL